MKSSKAYQLINELLPELTPEDFSRLKVLVKAIKNPKNHRGSINLPTNISTEELNSDE